MEDRSLMCGIAGIINKKGMPVERNLIEKMTDIIKHRGPDGCGYYQDDTIAFGHRRLAIIDISEDGQQPMYYDEGCLTITFNGEIYNYLEIRLELEKKGYFFKSRTDTEVILAAYKEWGENCVTHFNGMWAFSIHDKSRGILFCSRDRFGVKPFYYFENDEYFLFGSEIKQIFTIIPEKKANIEYLIDFLVTKICEHHSATFFKGVYKLPSGHNLIYDTSSNTYVFKRYYDIQKNEAVSQCSLEHAEKEYFKAFTNSIILRLRSDVKVGTCLSGGLDSSSVATIAAKLNRQTNVEPFSAITAVSSQKSNDESEFAKIVAEHSDMNWITVTPSYDDFVNSLEQVIYTQEEPFGSPSIIMQYYVMKTARRNGIVVLLDGQGGDETLLGYKKYYPAHFVSHFKENGLLSTMLAIRKASKNNSEMSIVNIVKYLVAGLLARARYAFYSYQHRYLKELPPIPTHLEEFSHSCLNIFDLQRLENISTNLPVLLRYEDKNSMAHSIETRLPFLDYKTLETALSIPGEYKIRDGWTKWILRRIMSGQMPDNIVWRKNKYGFEAPEAQWLSQHFSIMQKTVLASPILTRLCDMKKLQKMYSSLDSRSKWRLYSIALWEKVYGVVS